MRRSTGQATIELLVLCGLAAAVALALGTALASGAAAATAGALRRALRPPHPVHDDTWALGSPTWGPLLRRYAPRLVLERDRYGRGRRRAGRVHALPAAALRAARRRPAGDVRPPRAAPRRRLPPLLVLLPGLPHHAPAGWRPRHARRRLGGRDRAAHGRRRGGPRHGTRRPRRQRAVVGGGAGLAAGRAAPGDLPCVRARTRTGSRRATSTSPATAGTARSARSTRRSCRPMPPPGSGTSFDPAATPPWRKRLWRDPDAAGTGVDGRQGREVVAARAWGAAWEGLADMAR